MFFFLFSLFLCVCLSVRLSVCLSVRPSFLSSFAYFIFARASLLYCLRSNWYSCCCNFLHYFCMFCFVARGSLLQMTHCLQLRWLLNAFGQDNPSSLTHSRKGLRREKRYSIPNILNYNTQVNKMLFINLVLKLWTRT